MSEVIYFNSLKGKQGKYGLKLSGKAEDLIEEIKRYTNAKGYINLELKERKTPGKFGDTHYAVVDTWEPKAKESATSNTNDDLPF